MRAVPGFVIRIKPSDAGSRVSLRMLTGPREYNDVVGELISWSGGVLRVRRRDGSVTDVPEDRLVAGKVVPPAPPRRPARLASVEIGDLQLEEIASRGWIAFESDWLGRWLLRASEGFTGRGNSVLPLGDPGRPLDAAVPEVQAWYAERGLPARFQVPLPAAAELDAALAGRGWSAHDHTHVLTAGVDAILAANPPVVDSPTMVIEDSPSPQWLSLYRYRGGAPPAAGPRLLVRAERAVFASLTEADQVIAIARGALAAGWIGITAVEVAEQARRRGLASHLVRQLCEWAASVQPVPARCAYLQVVSTNAAALALYRRLGFALHHDYQYRTFPIITQAPAKRSPA